MKNLGVVAVLVDESKAERCHVVAVNLYSLDSVE